METGQPEEPGDRVSHQRLARLAPVLVTGAILVRPQSNNYCEVIEQSRHDTPISAFGRWAYQLLRAPASLSRGSRLPFRGAALKIVAHQREDCPVQDRGAAGEGRSGLSRRTRYALGRRITCCGSERAKQPRDPIAVETYAPKLYRYAVYQLGEHTAAEDVASETITRMLEKIDGYRSTGAPFQAWLFSIARNLIRDSYRRRMNTETISLDASMESKEIQEPGRGRRRYRWHGGQGSVGGDDGQPDRGTAADTYPQDHRGVAAPRDCRAARQVNRLGEVFAVPGAAVDEEADDGERVERGARVRDQWHVGQ